MKQIIQLYSLLRWPVAAIVAILTFSCPIAAVTIALCIVAISITYLYVGPDDHNNTKDAFNISMGICLLAIGLGIASVLSYWLGQTLFGWYDPVERRNMPYISTYAIFWLKTSIALVIFQILCTVRTFEAMRKEYIQKNGDI